MNALQEFETYLHNTGRSALTIKGYRSDIGGFTLWFEKTKKEPFTLCSVTPADVIGYCHMENLKSATSNRRLASLSVFMRWAVDTNLIEIDPTQECRRIQARYATAKYLDKEQQRALLSAIEHSLIVARLRYPIRWRTWQRDASLVIMLLNTGLRAQEALNLRMEDLTIGEQKGDVIVWGDEGKPSRSVPLNAEARKALQAWLSARSEIESKYVWVATNGKGEETDRAAMSVRNIQRVLWRMAQELGLPYLTPNMLRHTFAKNLVDSGVGLEKVAALLGVGVPAVVHFATSKQLDDLDQAVELLVQI